MLAILSDTHNNRENLKKALEICRAEGVQTILHCGDLTSAETAFDLAGFRVLLTFGNGDVASGEIAEALARLHPASRAERVFTGQLDGVWLAAAHGHDARVLYDLVNSGRYAYVFHGHSHEHEDVQRGPTRVINPGALGGLKREPRQFCLLDPASGEARFVVVAE